MRTLLVFLSILILSACDPGRLNIQGVQPSSDQGETKNRPSVTYLSTYAEQDYKILCADSIGLRFESDRYVMLYVCTPQAPEIGYFQVCEKRWTQTPDGDYTVANKCLIFYPQNISIQNYYIQSNGSGLEIRFDNPFTDVRLGGYSKKLDLNHITFYVSKNSAIILEQSEYLIFDRDFVRK